MKVVALAPDRMFGSRVRELLGAAGHDVTVLADRPAALAAAAAADALVVDLVTAPGGEAELAQAGVPVLGIYAHTAPEVRERALAAGFAQVVPRSRFMREAGDLLAAL